MVPSQLRVPNGRSLRRPEVTSQLRARRQSRKKRSKPTTFAGLFSDFDRYLPGSSSAPAPEDADPLAPGVSARWPWETFASPSVGASFDAFVQRVSLQAHLVSRRTLPQADQQLFAKSMGRVLTYWDSHRSSDAAVRAYFLLAPLVLSVERSARGGRRGRRKCKTEVSARIAQFAAGDWAPLLDRLRALYAAPHTSSSEAPRLAPSSGRAVAERSQRVEAGVTRLARCGQLSKAVRLLAQAPRAPPTAATLDALRALHPTEDAPGVPDPADTAHARDVELDIEDFAERIRRSALCSGGGPSAQRFEHFQMLLRHSQEGFEAFHRLSQSLVTGTFLPPDADDPLPVPPLLRRLMSSCLLNALSKSRGGVRPISVGESWRRLLAGAVIGSFRGRLREKL